MAAATAATAATVATGPRAASPRTAAAAPRDGVVRGRLRRRGAPGVRRPRSASATDGGGGGRGGERRGGGGRGRPVARPGRDAGSCPAPSTHGIEQTTLASGLRVVTETMPEARSVTLGAWVGVGARDEPDELSGASHFLEHLLFKGTADRSRPADRRGHRLGRRRDERVHRAGAHRLLRAAARTSRCELGVDILGDVLTEPAFRDRRRRVRAAGDPRGDPHEPRRARGPRPRAPGPGACSPDHPLGREVLGDIDTVEAMGRDEIAGFFDRWYRPASIVVAAAGDLDHDRGRRGGRGPRSATGPAASCPERTAAGPGRGERGRGADDTEQAHLCLGWRSRSLHDDAGPLAAGRGQPGARRRACPAGCSRRSARSGASRTRCSPYPAPYADAGLPRHLLRHRARSGPARRCT